MSGFNTLSTDPMEVLPRPGMSGAWTVASPYSTLVNANVEYVCTSVTTINSLLTQGVDVLETYYTPHGLTNTDYQSDADLNHCIITIQAATGKQVSFPSSYLLGFPNANAVVYSCLILSISLSPIPDSMNLASLKEDISDMVLARTGIKNEVKTTNHSAPHLVSQSLHTTLEANRQLRITNAKPLSLQIAEKDAIISDLQTQNQILEDYIAANYPPA